MAEYIAVPSRTVYPLPEDFATQWAALLEPALHALDLAKLRPASDVASVGAGAVGLYVLMLAQISGAGRACVIKPPRGPPRESFESRRGRGFCGCRNLHTNGRGADVVLEATTSSASSDAATRAARIGGEVVLVGIPDGDKFTLTASHVRRKGLTLKLSRRLGRCFPSAIRLDDSGEIDVDAVVTVLPLSDVHRASEMMSNYEDGVIKVVLEP